MGNDVTLLPRGELPFCEKCQKTVEWFEIEAPIKTIESYEFGAQTFCTGEIIVTIRCHAEEWAISNWRGRIQPKPRNDFGSHTYHSPGAHR